MLDKKPATRPSMAELLKELEALSETGLQDGPSELRPSEQLGAAASDAVVTRE